MSKRRAPLSQALSFALSLDSFNKSLIGFIIVVCPLLFFTNLTRNPYFTQIALLNIGIALSVISVIVAFLISKRVVMAAFPLQTPLLCFLAWALLTSAVSWWIHDDVRPGIQYEALRIWIFTLVNCLFVAVMPLFASRPFSVDKKPLNIWADIAFALFWAMMWMGFHSAKGGQPTQLIWDPYGGFLWALAAVYTVWRSRSGRMEGYFHLIFFVTLVAGLYGLGQYLGRDYIWSGAVTPYGGRPVSSFGNPNFLSSYVMMAVPLAMAFAAQARGAFRWGYGMVAVVGMLSTLSTLTRSSYVGLVAAVLVFGVLVRPLQQGVIKKIIFLVLLVVGLIAIFPKTPVTQNQSPLERFTEILDAKKTGAVYAPWHQRLLIWSSSLDMARERPIMGKGWGCFELFYPFYQGRYVLEPTFVLLRTHANNAHNIFLEILAQVGIAGTGLAIWVFVALLSGGLKIYRALAHPAQKILVSGMIAAIVGMVADNFFGNVSIFFAVPAFLFWWVVGALYREGQPAEVPSQPLSPKVKGIMAATVIVGLFSMVYYVKRWNQERYYFEGFKYARTERVAESVKSLEKAFSWFRGEVNSNYELGNSYARYAKSLSDQERVAESREMVSKSINAYEWALRANPGYDEIYFNLGITLLQVGRREEALLYLEKALVINPLLQTAYQSLGNQYLKHNEFDHAARIFSQATRAFPQEKDYWNNLGYLQAQLNQHESAYQSFQKALEIDPAFESARVNLQATADKLGGRMP
jgi:O-antigen ligase/Tfp pilus assembly protein PilF